MEIKESIAVRLTRLQDEVDRRWLPYEEARIKYEIAKQNLEREAKKLLSNV